MSDLIERVHSEEFRVDERGNVAQAATITSSKFDEIVAKLEDANTPIVEVSRMITIELAKVAQQALAKANDPSEAWKQKVWEVQIKVLTALAKQCNDTDILSKRDALNFDGPKFQYVMTEVVAIFKKTLIEVSLNETMVNNILAQFRDALTLQEPIIRRETEKIDSKIK